MSSSLSTPSTCFSSRYFASSTASYRTPFSRYDRSNSTPLRISEPVSNFYNRCVSEFKPAIQIDETNQHIHEKQQKIDLKSTNSEIERRYSRKNLSEIFKNKMLNEERKTNDFKRVHNRSTNPLYNDHIARYYQRISDIFEDETDNSACKKDPVAISNSKKPRSTFKSVLEDVKDLERKYNQMNMDSERRRSPTNLDHLRPHAVLESKNNFLNHGFTKLSDDFNKKNHFNTTHNQFAPTKRNSDDFTGQYDKLYEKTLQLYRDAATPPSRETPMLKISGHVGRRPRSAYVSAPVRSGMSPERYLAANLKTDIYRRADESDIGKYSKFLSQQNEESFCHQLDRNTSDVKNIDDRDLKSSEGSGLYCGLRRRYTNRETRLARQMLEHIKTEKKWTSNVERPFVLGI